MISPVASYWTDTDLWDFENALHFKCCSIVYSFDRKRLRIVTNEPHAGVVMEWSGSKLKELKQFLGAV